MQTIARVSALAIVALFLINVALGFVQAVIPHQVRQDGTRSAELLRSPNSVLSGAMQDLGQALTAQVRFFGNGILLDVQSMQFARTRKEVRLDLIVTPRPVEGYVVLRMDRLAVDAAKTALVTAEGTWLHVRTVHGVGLLSASETLRSSPIYAIGVPRQVELVFPALSPSVGLATLLVRWAPGRSAMYADGWRTDRIVEVRIPPVQ
jgi:hypothetical protein